MDRARLITRLKEKEGLRLNAYKDSLGFWTICYGHLLGPAPVPATADCEQCQRYLDRDTDDAVRTAGVYPFFQKLSDPLQNVFVELAFNMGEKLHKFVHFLHYMVVGDYEAAGQELKNSLAYKEEPKRFDELITALNTGEYPV